MSKKKRIKALFISNFSKALTGFGKNQKNVLRALYNDGEIEVVEAANGVSFGTDLRTPWKSYGTYPSNPQVLQEIKSDERKNRLAQYGNNTIDEIIKLEEPDVIVGIEDIWAFDWAKKIWLDKLKTVIWTTLDSSPILDQAYALAPKVDKFLVWASFAENEMTEKGYDVETLHGAVDYSHFSVLSEDKKASLKKENGLEDDFVIGFVFKNQLRKSVPNLLEGFKLFKDELPEGKSAKLFLHTDWDVSHQTWNIEQLIENYGVNKEDVVTTYICKKCKKYEVKSYHGQDIKCNHCGDEKSMVTKNNLFGTTEEQLNELYNIMDVYCHPFTSGGQELPIQEAKATGLITLVTEYSCGTDSCYEKDGGIPLDWSSYLEPHTNFVKATTCPKSIAKEIRRVFDMPAEEKVILIKNAKKCIEERFTVENTVSRLKEIILDLGKTDWDFDFEDKKANLEFVADESLSDSEWLTALYKGIFDKDFREKDVEVREGIKLIEKEGRSSVLNFLTKAGQERNAKIDHKPKSLEDYFLGDQGREKRIAIIIKESAGDVLMINSLMSNLKKAYFNYNIYVVTQPQFFCMIEDHPDVAGMIPYQDSFNNLLFWEGRGEYEGYVDAAFLPAVGSQMVLNYLHGELKEVDNLGIMSELDRLTDEDLEGGNYVLAGSPCLLKTITH